MINGLGVLGLGVGGIEAEAVMLGQPIYMLAPDVIGVRLTGRLSPGVTATDMTIRIVEMLEHGVVGKFVECGSGMSALLATVQPSLTWLLSMEKHAAFPMDDDSGIHAIDRAGESAINGVEEYCRAQGCGMVSTLPKSPTLLFSNST